MRQRSCATTRIRDVVQPLGSCLFVRSDEGATRHFTSQTHALGFATLLGIAELSGASIRSRPHSALMPALRENQQGFGLLIARNGDWNAASLLRRKTNFASQFKVIWVVQTGRERYSCFPLTQISSKLTPSRLLQRGVRVVTIRGCGLRWMRWRCARERLQGGESCERLIRAGRTTLLRTAKPCGPGARCWRQAL